MIIEPCDYPKAKLIYPNAHQLFLEGKDKPVYMHCVVGNCWICNKAECAKNLKIIDDIVKSLFRKA